MDCEALQQRHLFQVKYEHFPSSVSTEQPLFRARVAERGHTSFMAHKLCIEQRIKIVNQTIVTYIAGKYGSLYPEISKTTVSLMIEFDPSEEFNIGNTTSGDSPLTILIFDGKRVSHRYTFLQ